METCRVHKSPNGVRLKSLFRQQQDLLWVLRGGYILMLLDAWKICLAESLIVSD